MQKIKIYGGNADENAYLADINGESVLIEYHEIDALCPEEVFFVNDTPVDKWDGWKGTTSCLTWRNALFGGHYPEIVNRGDDVKFITKDQYLADLVDLEIEIDEETRKNIDKIFG